MNNKLPIKSSSASQRAELLKTFGVAALVLGFIAATIVYWVGENRSTIASQSPQTSNLENSWKDSTLSPEDSKGSSRTIEMNYGKVAVLVVNWLHWWKRLKPHEWLAGAIATCAIFVAISCFSIANRLLQRRI
jgi:multisubunit Na+/H+ antiporter MnhE subunit